MALLSAFILFFPLLAASATPAEPWRLVWQDEFGGSAGTPPDPAKWKAETGNGDSGWGNGELEYYCPPGSSAAPCDARSPNAYRDGRGRLVLRAVRTSSGAWTSARLKTDGLFSFQYGRVEARLRLPVGAGLWPAFWMLGVDISSAGWPACGELDIMENVPAGVPRGLGPGKILSTIHGPGYSGDAGISRKYSFPLSGRVDEGFHVYGMLWSPGRVAFYVDDWRKPFAALTPAELPQGAAWVFDKPQFLLLNLAVGGQWPGAPDAATPDPARMLVDYVRVYRARDQR